MHILLLGASAILGAGLGAAAIIVVGTRVGARGLRETSRTTKSFQHLLRKYRELETAFRKLEEENRWIKVDMADLRNDLQAHRLEHEELEADFQAYQEKMEAGIEDLIDELATDEEIIDEMIASQAIDIDGYEAAIERSIQPKLKPPSGLVINSRNRLIGLFDRNRSRESETDTDLKQEIEKILRDAPRDEP